MQNQVSYVAFVTSATNVPIVSSHCESHAKIMRMWGFDEARDWHEKFGYEREVIRVERGEFRYSVRWAAKGFRLVTWRDELAGTNLWVLGTTMAGLAALSARSWPIKIAVTRAPMYGVVIPQVIYKESGHAFETRLQRMNELLTRVENGDFDELPS